MKAFNYFLLFLFILLFSGVRIIYGMTVVTIKYFYEKTTEDYETHQKIWDENRDRILFLQTDMPYAKQTSVLCNEMDDGKDILGIRFPSSHEVKTNKVLNEIISGNGINIVNKIWWPKEVCVYQPVNDAHIKNK